MMSCDGDFYAGCLVFGTEALCDAVMERRLLGDTEVQTKVLSGAGMMDLIGTVACIVCAALAAGMTLGIVSLDAIELRVKMRTGTAEERGYASKLLPFVEREPRHQVLVTLLLLNSFANEALPLFLDNLVPTWGAIIISVTAVLFVGEILPSAIFTGPQKLSVASAFARLLSTIVFLFSPVAYPLAVALDRLMPEDVRYDTRQEIRALIEVQREVAMEYGEVLPFSEDEADLVRGAMSLSTTKISDVMVPIAEVFALDAGTRLDDDVLHDIHQAGYSRVPVRTGDAGEFTAYVLVRDMITLFSFTSPPRTEALDTQLDLHTPVWIAPDHSLFELLNEFQTGRTHMAFVSETPHVRRGALGLVTLEDIIEAILTEEIYDETDLSNARETLRRFLRRVVLPKVRATAAKDGTAHHPRKKTTTNGQSSNGKKSTNRPHPTVLSPFQLNAHREDADGVEMHDMPLLQKNGAVIPARSAPLSGAALARGAPSAGPTRPRRQRRHKKQRSREPGRELLSVASSSPRPIAAKRDTCLVS